MSETQVSRPVRPWAKRRDWLDRVSSEHRLTAGAKAWLLLLAARSDDQAKPVWGTQLRMAEILDRSDRSVQRYLVEAEQLGYVKAYRSRPVRGPEGRWCRRKSNCYYLTIPSLDGPLAALSGRHLRRQAAPRHLPDSHVGSTPFGARQPSPLAPEVMQKLADAPLKATAEGELLDPAQFFASLRASLPPRRGRRIR